MLPDAYEGLHEALLEIDADQWAESLLPQLADFFAHPGHGDYRRWQQALNNLPDFEAAAELGRSRIMLGGAVDDPARLAELLKTFSPWRKGPWRIGGVDIDAEWRSDWKWQRIAPHLELSGRRVLDVGCGNAYYAYRMLGAGADWIIGIDPGLLFVMQFLATRAAAPALPVWVLPLGVEALPDFLTGFDTVFSMGVLYHRRDHHAHLRQLRSLLRPDGELVLETLVLDEESDQVLVPADRYANMPNVYGVPSLSMLERWLDEAGFEKIERLDVTPTTREEQRSTEWMRSWSLPEALNDANPQRTVEGYPAPVRAVWRVQRPALKS